MQLAVQLAVRPAAQRAARLTAQLEVAKADAAEAPAGALVQLRRSARAKKYEVSRPGQG